MGSTPKLSKAGKIVLGVLVLLGIFAAKTYWWDARPEVIAEKEAKAKQDSLSNQTKDIQPVQTIPSESVQTTSPAVTATEEVKTVQPAPAPVKTTKAAPKKKAETPKVAKEAPKKTAPKKTGERENLEFNNF
jgi:outer membrane biosynthesis protein TonB